MWDKNNINLIASILSIIILKENKINITKNSLSLLLNSCKITIEDFFLLYIQRISESLNQKSSEAIITNDNPKSKDDLTKSESPKNANKTKTSESDMDLGLGLFD